MLRDTAALVVWVERTEKGAEIRARRINADGSRDQAIIVAESVRRAGERFSSSGLIGR